MSRISRTITSVVLCALCALVLAWPARASVKMDCELSGTVRAADKDFPDLGVRLLGGGGKFTMSPSTLSCVGTEKGIPAVVVMDIEATGFYESIACGTGKAIGTSITVLAATKAFGDPTKGLAYYNALLSDEKFAIDFLGMQGTFYWHHWNKAAVNTKVDVTTETFNKPRWDKDWALAGFATMIPLAPSVGNPPGNCTKVFSLLGDVMIHEA